MKLLTIHASKGLEFRYVYISGVNHGLLPLHTSGGTDDDQVDEEKRLFFVAITRAKDHLEMSYHTAPEGWNSCPEPSEFLQHIPPQLLVRNQGTQSPPRHDDRAPSPAATIGDWQVGQPIRHARYGSGTISRITAGNIFCTFGRLGEKSFSASFCPLTPDSVPAAAPNPVTSPVFSGTG